MTNRDGLGYHFNGPFRTAKDSNNWRFASFCFPLGLLRSVQTKAVFFIGNEDMTARQIDHCFLSCVNIVLTSPSNPTVKRLVKLRDNRARRKSGAFLVDGWRETRLAMQAGMLPQGVYVSSPRQEVEPEFRQAVDWVLANAANCLVEVSASILQRIAYGQSQRGVVAEFQAPSESLQSLQPRSDGSILVLDHFEKPGNIGAALRTADAAGVAAVILTPETADRFNPNLIRSSLGAAFTLPIAVTSEAEAITWLIANRYRIVTARVESAKPLWKTDLSGRVAIVIGNEAKGLCEHFSTEVHDRIEAVQIPMMGQVDSLNASVSAAVLLFEALRQNGLHGS